MDTQKRNLIIIILVALLYVIIFIPLNLRCSQDRNMLLCAGTDEYAQYPVVMSITTPETDTASTIIKMLDHKHYFYGYSFYFVSALSITPLRILSELNEMNYTRLIVLILRQLSPIFMAASLILLVAMWTQFRNLFAALSLFLFLAAVPAVFLNNSWWHVDSMVTFFVIATLFCLYKDDLRFRKWFYLGSVTCALSISTKVLGFFFVLTIPTYLFFGYWRSQLTIRRAIRNGAAFVVIMFSFILLSYPTLLLPGRAALIFETLQRQSELNNFGWGIEMEKGPLAHYTETLKQWYGLWPLYFLALTIGIVGLVIDKKRTLLNLISLTWIVPFSVYLLFVVARKSPFYFIPIALPLFAMIWNPSIWIRTSRLRNLLIGTIVLFLTLQFSLYLYQDVQTYTRLWTEEKNSPAIAFYKEMLIQDFLSEAPESTVKIFRDPLVYLPPLDAYDQRMRWGGADYSDIREFRPDFVLLQRQFIERYSDPGRVDVSLDKERALRSLEFYGDAGTNSLQGYREVFRSNFAIAFQKSGEE